MPRLDALPAAMREHLLAAPCPRFASQPWVTGPPLARRRVAIVSTAGLHRRSDRPFGLGSADYRIIPGDVAPGELVITHVSANFDRSGFAMDWNVVFPIERLREMARDGEIGGVASYHYSFMGATDPEQLEPAARQLAQALRGEGVAAALLVPV